MGRFIDNAIPHAVRLWVHQGVECAVLRHPEFNGYMGYVQIPPNHPWRAYDDMAEIPVLVHGGLTWGPRPAYTDPRHREVPAVTWEEIDGYVGFDTFHAPDLVRADLSYSLTSRWSQEDVESETEDLAEQVAAAAGERFDTGGNPGGGHDTDHRGTERDD